MSNNKIDNRDASFDLTAMKSRNRKEAEAKAKANEQRAAERRREEERLAKEKIEQEKIKKEREKAEEEALIAITDPDVLCEEEQRSNKSNVVWCKSSTK